MKVLLVCSVYTGYLSQLWNELSDRYPDIEYSLLTAEGEEEKVRNVLKMRADSRIYTYQASGFRHILRVSKSLLQVIKTMPQFDIVHFMWIEMDKGLVARALKKNTRYLFLSVGGSDLYRDSQNVLFRFLQKKLIRRSDHLSAENEATREFFFQRYGEHYRKIPMDINNFGVDLLDVIDLLEENKKDRDGESNYDRIRIACGHNANDAHQHLKMIQQIENLSDEIKKSCAFVFPMTYGERQDGYIERVESELKRIGVAYDMLCDYMNNEQMAAYIMDCDIMIHVQTTDQLSSTMLAHMYCGNVVIAGSWLPYASLKDAGIYFLTIDHTEQLSDLLTNVVGELKSYKHRCKENPKIVYELASWDSAAGRWYHSYQAVMGTEV